MVTKRIQLQGISRDKNADSFGDGECQEIINLRPRDGQWKIRKRAKKIYQNLAALYTNLWYHDQDGVGKWIGTLKTEGKNILCVIDPATGTRITIKEYAETENIRVVFLKRFLLAITDTYIDKFIFKEGTYRSLNSFNPPRLTLDNHYYTQVTTEGASTIEGIVGKYQKMIIDENNRYGKLPGALFLRIAYRLFDGSFALHTLPFYLNVGDSHMMVLRDDPFRTDNDKQEWQIQFNIGNIIATIDREYYKTFPEMQDIISSVVIFATKPETLYEVSEDTITQAMLDGINNNQAKVFPTLGVAMNDKFKNMVDSTYYKVKEISFQTLIDDYAGINHPIDTKGFWLGYATREVLTVDSNTYHRVSGQSVSVYNDRLNLGNTRTTFGTCDLLTASEAIESEDILYSAAPSPYLMYLLVTINTGQGIAYALNPISGGKIFTKDGKEFVIFGNRVIGYPDRRATEAKLIVLDELGTSISVIASYTLTASTKDNFAYYFNDQFDAQNAITLYKNYGYIIAEITWTNLIPTLEPYLNNIEITDDNRLQLSALRNPFVYPVANSYQVGTGAIIAAGVNTEAMSSGQYGQFPLIIFTTKGIYALEQGSGDVLFTSISPLNADIARSDTQIVNISNGVLYVTDRGIFIVLGKEVIEISKLVEGQPDTGFLVNDHFNFFFTDPRLGAFTTGLNTELSTNDILQYITGAIIGYDKYNNEIIFSNNDYLMNYSLANRYSYVYDLDTASWHKTDDVYEMFVSNYPHLYGIKVSQAEKNGIYDLTQDGDDSNIKVLVVTQPQNFDEPGIYKKISRMVLRAMLKITPGTYFTVAVFGSDDLRTWQLLTGGQRAGTENPYQNMLLTRGHGSFTYYRIVLIGQLHPDSTITGIDLTTVPRLNRKLRP